MEPAPNGATDVPEAVADTLAGEIKSRLLDPSPSVADLALVAPLRAEVESPLRQLASIPAEIAASDPLRVSKAALANVHACEERFLIEEPFQWSIASARGTVAHVAIRHWLYAPHSTDRLVERAISWLVENDAGVGDYLKQLDVFSLGELVQRANWTLHAFASNWPKDVSVRPVIPEHRMSMGLLGRRVVVSGSADIALGQPTRTTTGVERRRILLELKTGGMYFEEHRHDSFLYALLETVSTRVAPIRVATWYLDSGELLVDEVSEAVLFSAARRLGDGIAKIADLRFGRRVPDRKSGWRCDFCPLVRDCSEGLERSRIRAARRQ